MDRLDYAFIIFFVTLGPIKCLVPFIRVTAKFDQPTRHGIALKGTIVASIVGLFIVFGGNLMRSKWGISTADLNITFGILLLISSLQQLSIAQHHPPQEEPPDSPKGVAMSPIAFPTIITPYGIAALLTFAAVAADRRSFLIGVCILYLGIMVLNYLSMVFARQIVGFIRPQILQAVGWVLAVLQASLAVYAIVHGLRIGLLQDVLT